MRWIVIGMVATLAACAATPESLSAQAPGPIAEMHADLTADQTAEAEFDIRAILAAQEAAWNSGNIEVFMQGYWKSHDLRFASRDTVTHGWQNTLDNYEAHYTNRDQMGQLTFEVLELEVYTGQDARVFGSWALERPEVGDVGGLFTVMFRRFDAGWRIVSDHTSG